MQLNCKQCGGEILAEQVNLDRLIAKCTVCNAVFSFADQFPDADPYRTAKSVDVPLPKGIQVTNLGGELQISRLWYSPKYIFLAIFALIWNGFMIFWFGIAITNRLWPMALFGSLHGLIGLGLIYIVIAGCLNKTLIRAGLGELSIRHGPLPDPGNKQLLTDTIEQLYCKEKIHRGRNSISTTYEVHAVTSDGKHEKLLTGLDESEQALYLEQEIARYLGITDQRVRGEMGR